MYFDLSSCLDGLSLNSGDEINFEGHFSVNPDGPIPANTFKKIPVLRGSAHAIINGQLYDDCDSFGAFFRLAKLNTTFSGPNNNNNPTGCAASSLQYTISKSINANVMRAFFGEEHRQAVKVDALTLTYDPAILTAFEDLSVAYRIQGSQWFPLPNLIASTPGFYQAGFSFLNTASTIAGSNQVFQFRVNLTPSCTSVFGSSTSDDLYEIETKINYQNRAYTAFGGNEACIDIQEQFDKRLFQYQAPPTFSVEAVVGDVQSGEENIQWIIEHCNTSFESDAGITFIQMEKRVGDAAILFIEDISFPDAIDTLIIQADTDTSVFAFANSLSKRGTNIDPAEICNTFRITAKMNSCGENSVLTKLGWNCIAPENTDWTPALYAPCEAETVLLKASILEPLLSASFQEKESSISGLLCDTSTVVILVRNEETGNAFDIQSQIILPTGATLVPNSMEFSYPSSADFQAIAQEPEFLGDDSLGRIYQYNNFNPLNDFLHANGLPGFSINTTDSSEFKIKYRFITNCNYQNGELNRYSFQGITACGTSTNNAFAETNPIIFQAAPTVARNFEIELVTDEVITPNQVATFEIQVKNIGNNVSDNDKIEIELPTVFTYVPNSIQATAPNDWTPSAPTIKNNGEIEVFNLLLPVGIGQNENATFRFEANVGLLNCDSTYVAKIATTSTIEFTCTVDNETCIYDFNSSTEGVFDFNTSCEPVNCSINVGTQNSTLLMPDCDSTMFYCFNQYTAMDIEDYTILDNGEVVDSTRFAICDYRQVCIYTYAQISNFTGVFNVDAWIVDGITYTGTFSSITQLVDSMNVWDEGGNWEILSEVLIIQGGHLGGNYSRMEITFPQTGIRAFLGYDTRLTPVGVAIFLTEGFHQLVLTNPTSCVDTLNLDVIRQECLVCTPATVENILVENTNCGEENGNATINIIENVSDYTFNWSPNVGTIGETENIRTNLPSASYLVQIIDKASNNCMETVFVNVGNKEAPNATFVKTNATCGVANGLVQLSPDTYSYTWNDGGTGATRTDLREGRYIITVTDTESPDCTNLMTIEIEAVPQLIVNHTVFNTPTCLNNNGVVALDVSGGSGGYKSTFTDGNLSQTDLAAGAYDLIITDTITGCSVPYLFILENEIHQGAITITDTTHLVCAGGNTGAINFEIIYENGFRFPVDTFITDGQFTYENGQLPAGNYAILLKDGNNCVTGSAIFEIKAPKPLAVSISKTGDCVTEQGINLNIQGGVMPYVFDWADLNGIDNERDRTNLPATNYEVTVMDGNSCMLPLTITLDSCLCIPATIVDTTIIATACGQSTGVVAIEIAEPLADYSFIYRPNLGQEGATKNTRMALPAGDYEVIIAYQGDTTCAITRNITVTENNLTLELITFADIIAADCRQANGAITLNVAGDATEFNYQWSGNAGQVGATPDSRTNLTAGTYDVIITTIGSPNCTTVFPFTIPIGAIGESPLVDTLITNPSCGQDNGQVEFIFTDNTIRYNYDWSPNLGIDGNAPNTRVNIPAGDYEVTIIDPENAECNYSLTISITAAPPSATATIFPSTCDVPSTGVVVLAPASYTYNWADGFIGNE